MKQFGATALLAEPQRPKGYEETGSVSSQIPGVGITAQSSTWPNHTYGMEQDALREIGHHGFLVDAKTMAAILYDFAHDASFRQAVRTEFRRLQQLYADYQKALEKAYPVPAVVEPN